MAQPNGVVLGSITLKRQDALTYWVWVCSRHKIGTRTRFWERTFRTRDGITNVVRDTVTDEIWNDAEADAWFAAKLRQHANENYTSLQPPEGNPGPLAGLVSPGLTTTEGQNG